MKLTMAFAGVSPRAVPLFEGAVQAEGLELEIRQINNVYYSNLHDDILDVSEMSISETLIALERREQFGNGKWDWSAIPAYLSRGHAWAGLYVRADSPIKSIEELKGKRLGVPDFEMTQAVWMRNVFRDLYDIKASDITWYSFRKRGESHALELYLDVEQPIGVEVHWPREDWDEYEMLMKGELDASPLPRDKAQNNPEVRRLLPDAGKQVIAEYFRKTRVHQPNHHFIVQNRLLQEHPWVAQSLYDALVRSKAMAYAQEGDKARIDEATGLGTETFGPDPYPLGLRAMRPTLERAINGLVEQGLLKAPLKIEDVYHSSLLDS